MELTEDDHERIKEITSASPEFIKEAIDWWNEKAKESIKRFVVVTCYYEWLLANANAVDNLLDDWKKDYEESD
jgi:hypothetical protein